MKRMLLVAFAALLIGFAFAVKATVDTDTSGVTVEVASYVAIQGLDTITINVSTPGVEATGSDDFTVDTNEASGTVSAAVTTQPTSLSGLTAAVSTATLTTAPGTTSVTLTAAITVPLDKAPATYTGGLITITVTAPP